MHARIRKSLYTAAVGLLLLQIGTAMSADRPAELIDINRASIAELLKVPGMTESWAARIVRFRPYRTKLDLLEQGVVSPEVYRRIRDGIVAHRIAKDDAASQQPH